MLTPFDLSHQLNFRWPKVFQTMVIAMPADVLRVAMDGGRSRHYARIHAGSKPLHPRAAAENARNLPDHIIGAQGECGWAWGFHLYWHWDWPPIQAKDQPKLADFGDRDIKTHRTGSNLMLVGEHDEAKNIYICGTTTVGNPLTVYVGWLPGVECKLAKYFRDPRAHLRGPDEKPRPCYCVPMTKLNKMSDLP